MIPSYPAQIYEAGTSAAALLAVLLLALVPGLRRHPAALFAIGIGAWALGRFAVASLWRDPVLVAGLNGDQLVTGGIAIVALLALVAIAVRARRASARARPRGGRRPRHTHGRPGRADPTAPRRPRLEGLATTEMTSGPVAPTVRGGP